MIIRFTVKRTHNIHHKIGLKMTDDLLIAQGGQYTRDDSVCSTDIRVDDYRPSDYRRDTFSYADGTSDDCEKMRKNNEEVMVNIYRYKFTEDFMHELFTFAKVHQYDHRKDFKDAWIAWIDTNENMVNEEVCRLTRLGYNGDILDKMFKSARYYFRKKSTEKKAPEPRRDYVSVRKELLEAIDAHITNSIAGANYKPSDGFENFCNSNVELIKDEISHLTKSGLTDSEEIRQKIKKTYKNRYFLVIRK
jgi:hypothetical protein